MKLENYNTLKEMLLEFKRELGETDREIALHLRYIKEAEAHLKAFTEAETEDFKVFSPRKMEIIHKEEIDKIRNEKSFYEERNRELYRRKEYLDRRILKLTDILEKESGDLVLQEEKKPDLYSDHAKDLEEFALKIQKGIGYIESNPVQAKQDFIIIAKCLKETAGRIRNSV